MNRLLSAMKMDLTIQLRIKLYAIGIVVGGIIAVALGQLGRPEQMFSYIPAVILLAAGGSTLLYVAGMITFERDEGTLDAVIVSPLRPAEYLWSKVITLTGLATLESIIMIGGAMVIMSFRGEVQLPNIPILLAGMIAIGVIYTLIGIILIVRYDKITDFLIPMSGVAVILQLPFLYFLGWIKLPLFLAIPTSAPTMLMQGAYTPLSGWQWLFGILYTAALLVGLTVWAQRAFEKHIIMKVG